MLAAKNNQRGKGVQTQATLQDLFNRFNQRYWFGRLPQYAVFHSDRYAQGYCRKGQREIYINIGIKGPLAKRLLLHEMAHAATSGGHGKAWQAEMQRLARMGAPTKRDLTAYQNPSKKFGLPEILAEFEGAGFELPDASWADVRQNIGYSNSLIDKDGRPESKSQRKLLRKARLAFYEGRRQRLLLNGRG